jgi:hypothetical protein
MEAIKKKGKWRWARYGDFKKILSLLDLLGWKTAGASVLASMGAFGWLWEPGNRPLTVFVGLITALLVSVISIWWQVRHEEVKEGAATKPHPAFWTIGHTNLEGQRTELKVSVGQIATLTGATPKCGWRPQIVVRESAVEFIELPATTKAELTVLCEHQLNVYQRFEEGGNKHTWYIKLVNHSHTTDAKNVEVRVEAKDIITNVLKPLMISGQRSEVGIPLPFDRGGFSRTIKRGDGEFVMVASLVRKPKKEAWIRLGDSSVPTDQRGLLFNPQLPHRLDISVRSDNAEAINFNLMILEEHNILNVRLLNSHEEERGELFRKAG